MASFKTFNEIVSAMTDRLRLVQPNLDTKPGTVSRDLFVDLPADQLEKLYRLLALISEKQSIDTATGIDLDRYAQNYGLSRKQGTPATGVIVFTSGDISTQDIPIPNGTLVTSKNGVTFKTVGNYALLSSEKAKHAATAAKLRRALQVAGITDAYAIEVPIQATRLGSNTNVGSLQIISSSLNDDVKVINLTATSGGANSESDSSYRARVANIFSGANTGTALGYRNACLSLSGVIDALVVQPGSSLMLRDGTEVLQLDDNSFRILNSGTGGKVDIYILGENLIEVSESYIFTDLSGNGNFSDERNDHILGIAEQDITLTSEERRYKSILNGSLPLQPVRSMVSIVGSSSGVLSEKSTNTNGVVSGNYELIKDLNVETGGSSFGFDKVHFISNTKEVLGENLAKKSYNEVVPLKYSDIDQISEVYRDVRILEENSDVSRADKSIIYTKHSPITSVTKVLNKTTGEIYSIASDFIDADLGYNSDGKVEIFGKNLPSSSDILSVDYTWRQFYDKYVDYNGYRSNSAYHSDDIVDSIDWSISNGISKEEALIESDSSQEYYINLTHNISKVKSVYYAPSFSSIVSLEVSGESSLKVVLLDPYISIDSVESIIDAGGVEGYNTKNSNGTFSGYTIYLPSDTHLSVGDEVTISYNKVELYNIDGSDGSFYLNKITLPSADILTSNNILEFVENLYDNSTPIYISYVANIQEVIPTTSLSQLPFFGNELSSTFFNTNLSEISGSYQPVSYLLNESETEIVGIEKFASSKIQVIISSSSKSGKVRITGTSNQRFEFEVTAGTDLSGLKFDLSSYIKSFLSTTSIDSSVFISRIDRVLIEDSNGLYTDDMDVLGYEILNNILDTRSSKVNASLNNYSFQLPSTDSNSSRSLSYGTKIKVIGLLAKTNDFEDLYFAGNGTKISEKPFARIDKISIISGFKTAAGNLVGNIQVSLANQPPINGIFFADYNFTSPKEGERLTIRYNINRLIGDVTFAVEAVRPITADVIIREASEITIDVSGTILINDDQLNNTDFIVENVINAVTSILSTNRLGSTVDYSDIISSAAGINGVDSVNISLFNESGKTGRKSYIKALDNQTINPGTITFEAVSRKEFRIN